MKYIVRGRQGEPDEEAEFTLGDLYEAMKLDVRTLGLHVNVPAKDFSPMMALALVNKWNRETTPGAEIVYFLPEDPAWL